MQRRTNDGEGAIHGGIVYEGGGAYNAEDSALFGRNSSHLPRCRQELLRNDHPKKKFIAFK